MKEYEDKIKYIYIGIYTFLFICCFISQEVYGVMSKFSSTITFVSLGILLLTVIKIKDFDFGIVIVGCLVTAFNLIYIHSNKGAFFTAANLLIMLYISGKIEFSKKQKQIMYGSGALLLLFWYAKVRWDYNFNMAGLVFMITAISSIMFFELLKDKYPYLKFVQVISYFTGLLFCTLYHSRCAMMGMLIFGIIYMTSRLIMVNKYLKYLIVFASTVGAVLFTVLYVRLSHTGFNITILYKDVLSGRQLIWEELWGELLKNPITGVGSAYKLKSFFIFEVHNGLFDILAVHGFVVFACVLYLLIKKLLLVFKNIKDTNQSRIAIAGIFAILFTSFFENFFIVSPYLLFIFLLMNSTDKIDN